ncbi:MAG: preprotein translocase subunit YajC [Methylocystaceae bacterium]
MFTIGVAPANQWISIAIYLGAFVVLFYLMVVMPRKKQEKQHTELVNALAVRDRIITAGGIVGEIKKVKENSIIIRTAETTELEIMKDAIGRRVE